MDPVTHAVIGMTISKMSGNSLNFSNPVYTGIVVGSIFPDIDILLQKWGDYVYLKNHRGVTHSIIGLFASAALIAVVLGAIYHVSNIQSIFLWTFIGCLSHSVFDIFNTYGAKVLWPFLNKKFTISMLIIFDPVFIGSLIGYIISHGILQYIFIAVFLLYLILRAVMKLGITYELRNKFKMHFRNISVLPSMTGLLRWHFVLDKKDSNIIGEKDLLKRSIKIKYKLNKIQDEYLYMVLDSKPGKFFIEFTPLYHVSSETEDKITKYVFTDMRYCTKNNFLHHAVFEVDENDKMITANFNPYSMNRSSNIPI